MNQYIIGTQVKLSATFTDQNGDPIDPTAVTAEIRTPDQVITDITGTVQRASIGVYFVLYTVAQNGLHMYRFAGSGAVVASSENSFTGQSTFPS